MPAASASWTCQDKIKTLSTSNCVTAIGNLSDCTNSGCYAVKCTGSTPNGGVKCNSDKPIFIESVDMCPRYDGPGESGRVFDINNEAFEELADSISGPIKIKYKKVDCSKLPKSNSCIIDVK